MLSTIITSPAPPMRSPNDSPAGFSPETVAACLVESHELLTATAELDTHLTVLAERLRS